MAVSDRYRNFGETPAPVEEVDDGAAEALEELKLQAFEAGYKVGWDDALKANAAEREKLSAELSQNLMDMSFTYHEALSKLTLSMEPSLRQIVEKLLPEILRSALGAHVFEQVRAVLNEDMKRPVRIVVQPKNVEAVEDLLQTLEEPFEISGDSTLGDGQAFIRFGDEEREIDLDTVIAEVTQAIAAFFHETAQETVNG